MSGGACVSVDVLVLGGGGMLGHKIFQKLRQRIPDTWCTLRPSADQPRLDSIELFSAGNVIWNLDASDWNFLRLLLSDRQPRVIVNCIGIVKQRNESKDAIRSIEINSLLPHRLAELCQAWNGRLIHFSTDCVFSGRRGSYTEDDISDAEDLYGRTKFLGEVDTGRNLTLRTSIIGRELSRFKSLLEWLLQQNHKKISGYTRAYYSGVTTNYLADLTAKIIEELPSLSGLYQVTATTITKHDLLCLLREAFSIDVEIESDAEFFCDRSMNGERFLKATGYRTPSWPELVEALRADPTPYEKWRSSGEQSKNDVRK